MNRVVSTLTIVACAGLLVVGCAPSTQLSSDLSSELQSSVVTIAELASEGDVDAALVQLDELEQSLLQATAESRIDSARSAQISAAITLVRTDLEALSAQEQADVPTPAAETPISNDSPAESQPGNDDPDKSEKPAKPEKPDKQDKPEKKDEKGKGKND